MRENRPESALVDGGRHEATDHAAGGLHLAALVASFACTYLIWGSTYLAIRFAIETIPPMTMGAMRFLAAGAIMFGWAWIAGRERPSLRHWRTAAVTGVLLFLGGNGSVVWVEQFVPSGQAALLVAMTPLWMALLHRVFQRSEPLGLMRSAGLMIGMVGVILLTNPFGGGAEGSWNLLGIAVLTGGSIAWATGSLYSRSADTPKSRLLESGMAMLAGGAAMLLTGALFGELNNFDPAAISIGSALSLLYLIVFGSVIAFTAYLWLLRNTNPAASGTYAFVNPVVALLLGFALAGEPLTLRILLASGVIIVGVVLITLKSARGRKATPTVQGGCGAPGVAVCRK